MRIGAKNERSRVATDAPPYNSTMDMPTARITIARKDARDVRDRQIVVSLDGERLATLLYGNVVTRDVAPGAHRLRAHNTLFWKTLEVDLKPDEEVRFNVINRAGTGTFSLLGLFGVGPLYLTFEREAG
jgi:hypothetical protein